MTLMIFQLNVQEYHQLDLKAQFPILCLDFLEAVGAGQAALGHRKL